MLLQRLGNRGIGLGSLFERAAARHPANTVFLDHDLDVAPEYGRRVTVSELADLVDELSARLYKAGVRPAEHVVIYKRHCFDIVLLACAAVRIGAVPVLLSPALDGTTVQELLKRIGRPTLVTDQASVETKLPAAALAQTERVLLASGQLAGIIALADLAGAPRVAPTPLPAGRPTLITHTSGTTGTPKLAMHTARTLQARYRPQACALAPIIRSRELVAIHVSFVHSRLVTALAIALLRGFPVLMLSDPDLARIGEQFARLKPGILEAHPNSFMEWEVLATDPRGPLSNVKLFSSTFDALHPRTVQRLLGASKRRGALFVQLYGQSEAGPTLFRAFTRRRSLEDDGRCVGMPFPGMTGIRVVDRDGKPPTATNPGYLEVRTDGRVVGYLGEPARYDQQVSDGGWWRMGDVGYRTRLGCIHMLDREVDLIEGFGSTLAAEDILFAKLDQLAEVVLVPGAEGAAVPVVCTKQDRPLDLLAWRAAAAFLPAMADPVQLRLADLPKTATSKIKRLELAKLLVNNAARS